MARYGNNEYRDEYCELIINTYDNEGCLADFCVAVGNGRRTVYNWLDMYPKFQAAYEYAKELGLQKYNKRSSEYVRATNFNEAPFRQLGQPYSRMIKEQNLNALKPKKGAKKSPENELKAVQQLYLNGEIDLTEAGQLIKHVSDKLGIRTQADLEARLEKVEEMIAYSQSEEN